ncbi:hypothetical protein [Actinocrispum wychmicini]|uniref:Uncharacterized protein n=1 Tax=Actinocrispum wychmicini TaxID=1213861 RepID=A0A4R2JA94_9PSEU|nr:hypothetical protein [Actinocrispum wychmicini]TCO55207.1 hypothetical protein EV192_108497 [Actinocrispum wychmicini]
MAVAMKVTVAPDRISLRPGESADVELTIQNASQVVEHFAGSVVGLPSNDLYTCEPEVVKLRPREVGTLRMKITVPDRGGLVAGPYTLGLVVKSPYSQEVSRCEELPLEVQPAPALTMQVQPEVATGGKIAHYGVNLANEGNMPMAVTLSGTDPENRVGFKCEPKAMRLEPGQAAGANVTVNSDRPLTGQDVRRAVTLRANAGETVVEKPLTFVQTPRIKGGMMKFGALAAGLAVLGGLTYGGAKMMRDLKAQNTAQQSPLNQNNNGNNNNGNNNGQPSQSQPPPTSGGASSAPNSQGGQSSAPPPSSSQQAGPGATIPNNPNAQITTPIDFTVDASNQQYNRTTPLEPTHYGPQGVTMTNDPSGATTADCRNATLQLVRINPGTPAPGNPTAGVGVFLGSGLPAAPGNCAAVPVRFRFATPVKAINIQFAGLPDVAYTAEFTFQDGTSQIIAANGGQRITDKVLIGWESKQSNNKNAVSVTFGHQRDQQDSNKNIIMLKSLGFTVA